MAWQRLHPATPQGEDAGIDPLGRRRAGLTWQAVYGEVVPEMLEALQKGRDVRLVGGLLLALARIGEAPSFAGAGEAPAIAPILIEHVSDANREIAETAVIALGVLGSTEAVVRLADLVGDSKAGRKLCRRNRIPIRMRALAAYGLGLAGNHLARFEVSRFAVHHLSRVLETDARKHADLQAACVIALGLVRLDPARVPGEAVGNADWPGSCWAVQVEHMLELLVDEGSPRMVRAHVPTTLARLLVGAPADVKEHVAKALITGADRRFEKDGDVRHSCILALGQIGDCDEEGIDREIRRALMAAAEERDALGRGFAVLALAQTATRLGNGDEVPPASEKDVVTFLLRKLSRGKSLLKPWAGLSLGLFGHGLRQQGRPLPKDPGSALSYVVRNTATPETAVACALAAGLAGEVQVREKLEEMLGDSNVEHYRGPLALALGLLGDSASIPAVKEVMDDALHKPRLMEKAAIARALLLDRELITELIERLEETDCWASTWGVTRALAWTADHRALGPLLDILGDRRRSESERGLAAEALGWIADKEPLPWDTRISAGLNYTVAPETLTSPVGLGILDTR